MGAVHQIIGVVWRTDSCCSLGVQYSRRAKRRVYLLGHWRVWRGIAVFDSTGQQLSSTLQEQKEEEHLPSGKTIKCLELCTRTF